MDPHTFFTAFINTLFNPIGIALALGHIVMVLIYAQWKHWGRISFENGILGIPGGAIAVSPPLWEGLFAIVFFADPTPSGHLIALIAVHMLRIRLILNLSLLVAMALRYTGHLRAIICMDNRTWVQAEYANGNCNHNGACGAFATVTLWGLFPGIAILAIINLAGYQVPMPVYYIGLFPIFFLGAKHWHFPAVGAMSDVFGWISEVPGWALSSLLLLKKPQLQVCEFPHRHLDHS